MFTCLKSELPRLNYSAPLGAWLDAFPAQQVMVLQYENLTSPDHSADNLRAVKRCGWCVCGANE